MQTAMRTLLVRPAQASSMTTLVCSQQLGIQLHDKRAGKRTWGAVPHPCLQGQGFDLSAVRHAQCHRALGQH